MEAHFIDDGIRTQDLVDRVQKKLNDRRFVAIYVSRAWYGQLEGEAGRRASVDSARMKIGTSRMLISDEIADLTMEDSSSDRVVGVQMSDHVSYVNAKPLLDVLRDLEVEAKSDDKAAV